MMAFTENKMRLTQLNLFNILRCTKVTAAQQEVTIYLAEHTGFSMEQRNKKMLTIKYETPPQEVKPEIWHSEEDHPMIRGSGIENQGKYLEIEQSLREIMNLNRWKKHPPFQAHITSSGINLYFSQGFSKALVKKYGHKIDQEVADRLNKRASIHQGSQLTLSVTDSRLIASPWIPPQPSTPGPGQ